MHRFIDMDPRVPLTTQMAEDGPGAVTLVNIFTVDPAEADRLLAAWEADARIFKAQPGFISTQLHRGIAGSGVFLNYAVWESVARFRAAFDRPEFRASLAAYPDSTTISPHLFRKLAVGDLCAA